MNSTKKFPLHLKNEQGSLLARDKGRGDDDVNVTCLPGEQSMFRFNEFF